MPPDTVTPHGGDMTRLSDLLTEANRAHPMSTRKRSEKISGRLHFATIADYQRGDHPASPDEATLQSLADAYDLQLEDVQAAAGVSVGVREWTPPPEVARLSRRQQDAITELILSIAKSEGGQSDGQQPEAQKSLTETPPGGAFSGPSRHGENDMPADEENVVQVDFPTSPDGSVDLNQLSGAARDQAETPAQRGHTEASEAGEEDQDPGDSDEQPS